MRTKKPATAEQKAAAQAKRDRVRQLVKQFAALPEAARIEFANQHAKIKTVEGRELSQVNTMLVYSQLPGASLVGGFSQWKKNGRAVRKGEHGAAIYVPCSRKQADDQQDGEQQANAEGVYFTCGTVFDIGQTDQIDAGTDGSGPDYNPVESSEVLEGEYMPPEAERQPLQIEAGTTQPGTSYAYGGFINLPDDSTPQPEPKPARPAARAAVNQLSLF